MITETGVKYFLKRNRVIFPPMSRNGDDDDDGEFFSTSFQQGGQNYNEQVGLVNMNAQANLNVTIFDSGAGAAAGTGVGAGGAAMLGAKVAAWIPVAGVVIAAVSAAVGIVQMIDTYQAQKAWQKQIDAQNTQLKELQESQFLAQLEYQLARDTLMLQIELRERVLKQNQMLLIGGMSLIVLSGFVFAYKLRKK